MITKAMKNNRFRNATKTVNATRSTVITLVFLESPSPNENGSRIASTSQCRPSGDVASTLPTGATLSRPRPRTLDRKLGRDAKTDREDPHLVLRTGLREQPLRQLELKAEQAPLREEPIRKELGGRAREDLLAVGE